MDEWTIKKIFIASVFMGAIVMLKFPVWSIITTGIIFVVLTEIYFRLKRRMDE